MISQKLTHIGALINPTFLGINVKNLGYNGQFIPIYPKSFAFSQQQKYVAFSLTLG